MIYLKGKVVQIMICVWSSKSRAWLWIQNSLPPPFASQNGADLPSCDVHFSNSGRAVGSGQPCKQVGCLQLSNFAVPVGDSWSWNSCGSWAIVDQISQVFRIARQLWAILYVSVPSIAYCWLNLVTTDPMYLVILNWLPPPWPSPVAFHYGCPPNLRTSGNSGHHPWAPEWHSRTRALFLGVGGFRLGIP